MPAEQHDSSQLSSRIIGPTLDKLFGAKLYTQLQAHGQAVGLPSDDDMGNSEIGHNALGAGRVFDQGAKLVNRAIETGSMYEGEVWKTAIAQAKQNATAFGLVRVPGAPGFPLVPQAGAAGLFQPLGPRRLSTSLAPGCPGAREGREWEGQATFQAIRSTAGPTL